MTKKVYRVRNWKEYNQALTQRGSLTFWFSEEVISHWKNQNKLIHMVTQNTQMKSFYLF